ncbi:hypothetical protein NRIC_14900 [Enterococcus florum]|uniref:Gram-positive cocci surface proteins LPxTG domain-containing protein n=1 Tax=Enterococcus florum TaxID=2480627 RepID=A0A4V0WPE7_9ENTE|nr:Ig-like domain-containing protein [Enterococcus florum]GCF93599.1 hypothetical protein NRIC_14900 [Enterococcus florum]
MKHTRMERHEEKIRATIKRNKKIITFTTLVGLICPATLGTIQALADETAPPVEQTTEQTTEPVTEPVTPEQPINETPSQEPVTPEPEQTAPIEQVTEVPTDSTPVQAPVTAETPVNTLEQTQAITPLSNPTVVAEYRAKLANYQAQANQLVADGATPAQMATINALLSAFESNINNYENDIGDVPTIWLADIDSGIIPTLETEIQTVSDQLSQPDLSALHAKWQEYMTAIQALLDELESKVTGTSYQTRYTALWNRWDTASITGNMFPENVRDQAFYDIWLPELASILEDLQQLKADISSEPTVSVTGVTLAPIPEMGEGGTYQLTATVMPENATNKDVTFTSSNPSVATVDANGIVTAISEGTFTITVTTVDGGFTASTNGVVKADDGKPMKDFDYTAVLAAIARYDAMVKDEYTPESWKAMEAEMINNDEKLHLIDYLRKLPNAEGTVPPGYENQFQTDLNAYAAKAQSIMDMAIKKDVTPPKDVDKSGLEEAIKKGDQAIKDGNLKDDSKLVTAIEDGKKILNDDKATQAQVNEAVKNITEAINALEKADNGGNGNGGNNGNDNNQNGNNNGSNSNNGTGNNNQNTNTNQNKANNSNNQSNKNNTNNKDNLPLTGDTTTNGLLAGLSMVGLSAIALLKRKRKA